MEFTNFIARYPESTNVPEAALLQAQAEFKQGKLTSAITLLQTRKARAGQLADQYVYWIGEAQFAASNFPAAAETFISLVRNFPDSPLRLRAVVEAAAASMQATNAPLAAALLEDANGVFQLAAQTEATNELVVRGQLLLGQARFLQKDFGAAARILKSIDPQSLPAPLQWQSAFQLFEVRLAAGDLDAALAVANHLLQIAQLQNNDARRAEAASLKAEVLELLNRPDEAIAAYHENLATNAPAGQQQRALLEEARLAVARGLANARPALKQFFAQFTNSPARDVVLLTLGELTLKAAAGPPADTNGLQEARMRFDQFTNVFPDSPLIGKAYLDRGWCLWLAGNTTNSLADFETAAKRLPPSPDLAVARFKMGDAQFAQGDFAGARKNYESVADNFTNFPDVGRTLGAPALYQTLRACMKLNDMAGADKALAQILKVYPASGLADNSLLLFGEGLSDFNQPARARAEFERFQTLFPDSPLRPEAQLAVARTYEQEQNWPVAIGQYEKWLADYPTNALRVQADYALAWANDQAGHKTNAFLLFTNFVAQYPTNDLTPRAQWWVAGYFFNEGDYPGAEKNYKFIYQNFATNDLACQARMMAGRAAVGRQDYRGAIRDYFRELEEDTNCPMELRVQATFAHGSALMRMESTDTNNPLANFQLATNRFSEICQLYPTHELGVQAWGEIGDCDLQLANYDAATNAYAQVINSPVANIAARSQAQIGLGQALEKKAAGLAGDDQKALLGLALKNYLDVFYESNLRDGEQADAFWTKKAGLQALPLIEGLGESPPENFFNRMELWLPQLKDSLEKARAALPAAKS